MHRFTNLLRAIGETAKGCAKRAMRSLEAARNGGRRRRMRVVESLALGGRRQLLLVICDEQEYLVGTGADSVETIVPRPPTPMMPQHEGVAAGQPVREAEPANAAMARAALGQVPGNASGASLNRAPGRSGASLRDGAMPGPWLIAAAGQSAPGSRIAEERIEGPEQSRGRHRWQ